MSTKDFAETLKEAYYIASIRYYRATGKEIASAHTEYQKAESDLLQAIHAPDPHTEDFPTAPMEYAIETASSISALARKVNTSIADGWEPVGGVMAETDGTYLQSIIRKVVRS